MLGGSGLWHLWGRCSPSPLHGSRALCRAPAPRGPRPSGRKGPAGHPCPLGAPLPRGGQDGASGQRPGSGDWGGGRPEWRGRETRGAASGPRTSSPRRGAGEKLCGNGQGGDVEEEDEGGGGRGWGEGEEDGEERGRGSAEAAKQSEERGRAAAGGGGGGVGGRMGRKKRKRREQPGRRLPARIDRPRGRPSPVGTLRPGTPFPGRLPGGPG